MLRFTDVDITNFLSIGHVNINLENKGVVLIEGINETNETFKANGAGKSTIFAAITWALYDTTTNGLKADAVVNRKFGKGTAVILNFEVGESSYRIERYRKHSKNKNKVKLFHGDTEITGKSASETNAKIAELFGIDFNTYINSIMYGQGDVEMFSTATDKGKKEILENVTNIAIYSRAQEVAKEKIKELSQEVIMGEQALSGLNMKLEMIAQAEQQDLEGYKQTANLIVEEQTKLNTMKEQLASLELSASNNLVAIDERIAEAQAELASLVTEDYGAVAKEVADFSSKINTLKNAVSNKVYELNNARSLLERTLNDDGLCPTCGTPLGKDHDRQAEVDRLNEIIVGIEPVIANTNAHIPTLEAQLAEKVGNLNNKQAVDREINQKAVTVRQNIQMLEEQKNRDRQAVDNQSMSIATSSQFLTKLESIPKPEPRDAEREAVTKEIQDKQKEMDEVRQGVQLYTDAKSAYADKGIRSMVLDLVTPFLNEQANKYLGILSGSDIEINFTTQVMNKDKTLSDKFDIEIINASGGDTYKANSGGEQKRIDLAISFAIQDLVQSKSELATNIALYDECFDGLDSVGCENVVTLLKERQETVESIFVITHNENLKPLFEQVITIKKQDGVSALVEEDGKE